MLTEQIQGRVTLAAVDALAEASGLVPGLPLADARALQPDLETMTHDPAADGAALRALAVWCGRYSPWTAPCSTAEGSGQGPGGSGGLLLDITGCAHLFAPAGASALEAEEALLADLAARLEGFGFTLQAGLAGTIGAAWALARFAASPERPRVITPPKDEGEEKDGAAALASLPPAALRLSPAACELLARFGIRRIEQLMALPASSLAARFGKEVNRRLRQALGRSPESLSPLVPVPDYRTRRHFADPISTPEDIARSLDGLLAALCRQLETGGQGARRLELACYRVDGSLARIARAAGRPNRDPRHLARLFREELGKIDPGFGIETMIVSALTCEPLAARQLALAEAGPGFERGGEPATEKAIPEKQEPMAELFDRLTARLGERALRRPWPRESHIPERAVAFRAPHDPPPAKDRASWPSVSRAASWSGPARPLRLLPRPEPVEATALLPDHPPQQFRWRRLLHQVVQAEGPERLTPEWWLPDAERGAAPPRDYFRVEVASGGRYWLYRADGRWFLHGFFA